MHLGQNKKCKKCKHIMLLCIQTSKHPNTDSRKFTEYMDMTMNKLSKENKLIFVMEDFNLNLLNCESHSETNDFLNCMVSHYLLPYILHPTQVTDHSATVIDNIFCNNTVYDTFSGNILCYIIYIAVTGVMHEADDTYSIWSTWSCYWLDQFLTLALNAWILSGFVCYLFFSF